MKLLEEPYRQPRSELIQKLHWQLRDGRWNRFWDWLQNRFRPVEQDHMQLYSILFQDVKEKLERLR